VEMRNVLRVSSILLYCNGSFQKRSIPPHRGHFCCPKGEGGKMS
jgi:hypothetical protein